MKKIGRIFLVLISNTLQYKGEMFVWILLAIFNSMSVLLLWIAGYASGSVHNINLSFIQIYYVAILVIAQGFSSHAEEGIVNDIRTGNLSMHLLKPFPYFWLQFFEEIAWRVIGVLYSVVVFGALLLLIGGFHAYQPVTILPILLILMLTFVLSFLLKATLAMLAFFVTESKPFFELFEVTVIVIGGYLMPLEYVPPVVREIAFHLPFVSVVYFPVKALTGTLPLSQMPSVILGQVIWIIAISLLFWYFWKKGLRAYTALGL